jgi:hypothetical protein
MDAATLASYNGIKVREILEAQHQRAMKSYNSLWNRDDYRRDFIREAFDRAEKPLPGETKEKTIRRMNSLIDTAMAFLGSPYFAARTAFHESEDFFLSLVLEAGREFGTLAQEPEIEVMKCAGNGYPQAIAIRNKRGESLWVHESYEVMVSRGQTWLMIEVTTADGKTASLHLDRHSKVADDIESVWGHFEPFKQETKILSAHDFILEMKTKGILGAQYNVERETFVRDGKVCIVD